jgi:hypothetical protein
MGVKTFALVATAALIVTTGISAANATPVATGVQFQDSQAWMHVPANLSWTSAQIRDAKIIVAEESHYFDALLTAYRKAGATRMTAQNTEIQDPKFASTYPEYANKFSGKQWVGLKANGKVADVSNDTQLANEKIPPITEVADLFQLNADKCSLSGFNLFNPATWFQTQCQLVVPSLRDVLRVSLIADLRQPFDFAGTTTDIISTIQAIKAPYEVRGNRLYCQAQISDLCSAGIQLSSPPIMGTALNIKIGPGKWDFTLKVDRVSAQEFASHMALDPRKDPFKMDFLSYWGNGTW